KIYRATLTLQIDQQESKVMAVGSVSPNDTSYYDSQNFYQTQYELLKSDALAQRVIEQLNLVAPSQTAKKSRGWLDIFRKDDEKENDATPEEAEREIKLWFEPDEIIVDIYPTKTEDIKSVKKKVWA
ncbi:MAG TPA: hypothetical protein PLC32_07360, partial [Candidatus Omnitrophota bacterium]|nr:hypothetical protein [Candidatus Omnitrophota bacterium]